MHFEFFSKTSRDEVCSFFFFERERERERGLTDDGSTRLFRKSIRR